MPEIKPIAELRNTGKISKICHEQEEPVFITKNEFGDLVITSMQTHEKELALSDIYQKLSKAARQIAEGIPLMDCSEVFKQLGWSGRVCGADGTERHGD